MGENHLAEVTQKFWVVTEGLAYELARIFLDFGSQTDFPKRFLAQVVEGTTSHNIVGQDAIKETQLKYLVTVLSHLEWWNCLERKNMKTSFYL